MKQITEKSARRWMKKHIREVRAYQRNLGLRKPSGQWQRQYLLCRLALGDIRFRDFREVTRYEWDKDIPF